MSRRPHHPVPRTVPQPARRAEPGEPTMTPHRTSRRSLLTAALAAPAAVVA
ncbi:hypothetical protein GTW71_11265, partial [Streptomyces sp. SID6041]|nr:hypothetical protein [Streptomyces sp. SID6041]